MAYKILLSKIGKEAAGTTVADDLTFSSDYNTLKYFSSGAGTLTIVGDGTMKTATGTVAHNLGYKPFFTAYVLETFTTSGATGYTFVPKMPHSLSVYRYKNAYVDTNNLYYKFWFDGSGTETAEFSWKIFKNKVDL